MKIIISPHFDDAVYSLGSFIKNNQKDVTVVTVFAGAPRPAQEGRWDLSKGFRDSDEAMMARKEENRAAMEYLGVSGYNVINLPIIENQYRKEEKDLQTFPIHLKDLVKRFNKYGSEFYVPLGLRTINISHTDHILVSEFFRKVARSVNFKGSIFFYEEQPYYGIQRAITGKNLDTRKVAELEFKSRIEKVPMAKMTDEERRIRIEASCHYRSQVDNGIIEHIKKNDEAIFKLGERL